jgi:hypothetical protein
MELAEYTLPALYSLVLTATTYGVCRWRYERRLKIALQRMQKLDAARQAAGQRALQARRQVEQLQKELAEQHRVRADSLSGRRRSATAATGGAVGPAKADIPVEPVLQLPPNGFADTQPMCVRPETRPVELDLVHTRVAEPH